MGGFCFDTSNAESNFLTGNRTRVTLTKIGVCTLADLAPELLPDISEEQIQDKSKADGLGKALACFQAFWFCTECISRLATGLSITLLELNTFAHALCALLASGFWWSKPHDVNEPVLIQGPAMYAACAAMCMRSRMGAEHPSEISFPGDRHVGRIWEKSLGTIASQDSGLLEALALPRVAKYTKDPPIYSEVSVEGLGDTTIFQGHGKRLGSKLNPSLRLHMGQSLFGFGFRRRMLYSARDKKLQDIGILHIKRPFIDLTSSDILLWRLASQGLRDYPLFHNLPQGQYVGHENTQVHRSFLTEFCIDRALNVPGEEKNFSGDNSRSILYTFLVAGLCYGMLHLSAWHAPFRSHAEAVLWRISAITLAVSGFVPFLFLGANYLPDTKTWDDLAKFITRLEESHLGLSTS
ncbi:uncharacterized protein LY89DRAFT_664837 [Mollisia scopiformis]|uniref:Uncharacterized protein n=1 Tax=Mollisia scopiformis TaxID=149040 RepID=A0A194XN19_MOLSC|nr:uncharacterized protein LY89DRAFT_664837 [Mollisia scopiformis]KUJ21660.1 hypothetical protein LY89DRAFT_664837 [Mollisia scopiformis]